MSYNVLYQGKFKNVETDPTTNLGLDTLVTVNIYDTESGEAETPTTIILLEMADKPVSAFTVDDDEDKFKVVRSKGFEINVHSGSGIGIETFVDGGDKRFYVEIIVTPDGGSDRIKFKGWLSVADITEDFQPDPNVLTLTATDGLAMMEDETLVDFNGEIPEYEWTILDFLCWAFAKGTGIQREIFIVLNTREENAPAYDDDSTGSGHIVKWCYLDAKTFEADIHVTEDCKTVVEKILGRKCFVTTWNGAIWIQSIDEIEYGTPYYMYRYLYDGTFFSKTTINLLKQIGVSSPMQWMNDDCHVSAERAVGLVKLTYNYDYAKEMICNIDLDRGEGDEPTGAASEEIEYVPECIDFLREGSAGPDPEDIDFEPYPGSVGVLRKTFEYGYEKGRLLSAETAGGFKHYFKFSDVFVTEKGKITFSFDYKFNVDDGSTNVFPAVVRLLGDDGSIWQWNYDSGTGANQWVSLSPTDGWFTQTWEDDTSGLDNTEWRSMSATSPALPTTGRLQIRLVNQYAPPKEVHFVNLQLSYTPFINNSYQRYTKQVHSVAIEGKNKATIKDEVFISDGTDKRQKGALLIRGADIELYSGVMDLAGNEIQIDGDVSNKFRGYIGKRIVISGTASNNKETTITSVDYHLVPDVTIIEISGSLTTEAGVDAVISLAQYVLAGRFYRGHLFPAGTTDDENLKPYGEIQAFDVSNQYNRTMRKFEGTVDHLQTDNDDGDGGIPDLPFQVLLSDPNLNSNQKAFMMLHFEQDYHLCEWDIMLHEVDANNIDKQYTGHDFKYITEQ